MRRGVGSCRGLKGLDRLHSQKGPSPEDAPEDQQPGDRAKNAGQHRELGWSTGDNVRGFLHDARNMFDDLGRRPFARRTRHRPRRAGIVRCGEERGNCSLELSERLEIDHVPFDGCRCVRLPRRLTARKSAAGDPPAGAAEGERITIWPSAQTEDFLWNVRARQQHLLVRLRFAPGIVTWPWNRHRQRHRTRR